MFLMVFCSHEHVGLAFVDNCCASGYEGLDHFFVSHGDGPMQEGPAISVARVRVRTRAEIA